MLFAACGPSLGAADSAVDASTATCRSDRECSGGVCDRAQGRCVECVASTDCLGASQVCARNACITLVPCTSSRMCPGQVCDRVRSVCVDCVGDEDCSSDQYCNESYCARRPTPCVSSRECSAQAQVCDPTVGHCVDCVTEVDCADDEVCTNNRCARRVVSAEPALDASVDSATPDVTELDAPTPAPDGMTPIETATPDLVVPTADATIDREAPPDVLAPDVLAPDGSVRDVVAPDVSATDGSAPDVPAPNEADRCPGQLIASNERVAVDWRRARAASDTPTNCGSRAHPGAYRDLVFRFTAERMEPVNYSVGDFPAGSSIELQRPCGTPVPGQCRYFATASGGLGSLFGPVPAGEYQLVVEIPESAVATAPSTSFTATFATYLPPSMWTYVQSSPSGVSYVDACAEAGSNSIVPNVDDRGGQVLSTFPVQVFDIPNSGTTVLYASTNGWIASGTTRMLSVNSPIGDSLNADGLIAPLAFDLITTARGICSVTRGTAPARTLVVQWDHAQQWETGGRGTGDLNFQVLIHEAPSGTPNTIDFVYGALTGLTRPYVTGLRGTYQDSSTRATVTPSSAVRFTPMRR